MRNKRALSTAYSKQGIKGALSHVSGRLLGLPRYLRNASTIDFRYANLKPTKTIEDFIVELLPGYNKNLISRSVAIAKKIVEGLNTKKFPELKAPERWNSGKDLQYILAAIVLITKPEIVVETGTANGASASAIASALRKNKRGILLSFDITELDPVLISPDLRSWVELIKTDGSPDSLDKEISKYSITESSLFLHDADHSYLGQFSDYEIAKKLGFGLILSDDIDSSLAFADFARNKGVVYYDAPKFIGGIRRRSL